MNIPYILIIIIVLAIIAIVIAWRAKKAGKKLIVPRLLPISIILIVGAITISDRAISYSLIALGVIIAVVDAFRFRKSAKNKN